MKKISLLTAWHEEEEDFIDFINYIESIKEIFNEIIVVCNSEKKLNLEKIIGLNLKIINIAEKDFSKIRNYGIKNIDEGNSHCLMLDPDERLDNRALDYLKQIEVEKGVLYYFKRKNLFNGVWYRFTFPLEKQYRLIPRDAKFIGSVHERINTNHSIKKLSGLIIHRGYKDWIEAKKKFNFYVEMEVKRSNGVISYIKFLFNLLRSLKNYMFFGIFDGLFGLQWLIHSLKFWIKCLKNKLNMDLNG